MDRIFPGNPTSAMKTLNDTGADGGGSVKKLLSSKEYGSTLESRQQELVAKSAASLGPKSGGPSAADEAKDKEKQKMKVRYVLVTYIHDRIISNCIVLYIGEF